jgi:hypothetical protein
MVTSQSGAPSSGRAGPVGWHSHAAKPQTLGQQHAGNRSDGALMAAGKRRVQGRINASGMRCAQARPFPKEALLCWLLPPSLAAAEGGFEALPSLQLFTQKSIGAAARDDMMRVARMREVRRWGLGAGGWGLGAGGWGLGAGGWGLGAGGWGLGAGGWGLGAGGWGLGAGGWGLGAGGCGRVWNRSAALPRQQAGALAAKTAVDVNCGRVCARACRQAAAASRGA